LHSSTKQTKQTKPHSVTYYSVTPSDFKDTNSEKYSILSFERDQFRELSLTICPSKRALRDLRQHILLGKTARMMNIKINEEWD